MLATAVFCTTGLQVSKTDKFKPILRLLILIVAFALTSLTLMYLDFFEFAIFLSIRQHWMNTNLAVMTVFGIAFISLFSASICKFITEPRLMPVFAVTSKAIHKSDPIFANRFLSDRQRHAFGSLFKLTDHFTTIFMRNFNSNSGRRLITARD